MTPKDLNNWSNVDVTEVSDADLGNVVSRVGSDFLVGV